jgi:hypothetical protein
MFLFQMETFVLLDLVLCFLYISVGKDGFDQYNTIRHRHQDVLDQTSFTVLLLELENASRRETGQRDGNEQHTTCGCLLSCLCFTLCPSPTVRT